MRHRKIDTQRKINQTNKKRQLRDRQTRGGGGGGGGGP